MTYRGMRWAMRWGYIYSYPLRWGYILTREVKLFACSSSGIFADSFPWWNLFPTSCCFGKRSHYVHPPHSKWPRARNRMEFFRRWVYHLRVSLALITFADIPSGICLHIWPKVPLRYSFMRLPPEWSPHSPSSISAITNSGVKALEVRSSEFDTVLLL